MKVGIAGVGFMGRTHAAGWRRAGFTVAGLLAETADEAAPLAAETGAKVYRDLPSMLAEVDVLDVCSPTHLHAPMVLAAAGAGRAVVCEKPLARRVADGEAMIEACRAAHVPLYIAHVLRWFPEYSLARERVAAGAVGRIGTMRFERLSYRPKKAVGNWFLDEDKSGGIILDLMIHDIDFARWIGGEVSRVFARRVACADPAAPIDYGTAILTHESGALSHIAGAWAYPPGVFRTGFEISGDRGVLRHDSAAESPIESFLAARSGEAPDVGLPSSPLALSPYDAEIAEFADCLRTGGKARVAPEDGLAALRIALAALESAKNGTAVELARLEEKA
jgi:predicted dehydrogenase